MAAKKTPAKSSPAAQKTAAKKTATKKTAGSKKTASPAQTTAPASDVFAALRAILMRHAKQLVTVKDEPTWVYLDTKTKAPNGKPLFFGGVRAGKAYTSFYLMPVYTDPDLLSDASAALRKRMQGKSCFNFKASDAALLAELDALTSKSFRHWKAQGRIG